MDKSLGCCDIGEWLFFHMRDLSPLAFSFLRVGDTVPCGYECPFCSYHCPASQQSKGSSSHRQGQNLRHHRKLFWIERVEKNATVRNDVLQKGGGDSKEEKRCHLQTEVFSGQSASNYYFAFQVLAYKHKAKNTFGNIQLAHSLGN